MKALVPEITSYHFIICYYYGGGILEFTTYFCLFYKLDEKHGFYMYEGHPIKNETFSIAQ